MPRSYRVVLKTNKFYNAHFICGISIKHPSSNLANINLLKETEITEIIETLKRGVKYVQI